MLFLVSPYIINVECEGNLRAYTISSQGKVLT